MEWVRLAAPNARFNYGMRKRAKGEKLLFGGNDAEYYGMQIWHVGDGVATAADGKWEFISGVHWYSLHLPPAPEQPLD